MPHSADPRFFSNLNSVQVDSLPKKTTVFLLAVSPIEDHGPTLPVGLSLQIAEEEIRQLANRIESWGPEWKAIILPSLALGCDTYTDRIRLRTRGTALRDAVMDWALSLHKLHFQNFCIVSGQAGPRQLTAIEEACRYSSRRANGLFLMKWKNPENMFRVCSLSSCLVQKEERKKSIFLSLPTEHGGRQDTSFFLALSKKTGTPASAPTSPDRQLALSHGERIWKRLTQKQEGHWGTGIAQATAEEGDASLQKRVEKIAASLKKVLDGMRLPDQEFRSGYSYFLPNHTTFSTLIWTVGITVVFLSWVTWIVQFMLTSR